MGRRVGTVVAVVLAVLLCGVLLWPDGWAVNRLVVQVYVVFLDLGVPAAVAPEHYAALLNVLAFAVLGWLGVAVLRRRPWLVVAVLTAASVLVEATQLWPALRREASPFDVACNVAGALLGAGAASLLGRRARRRAGGTDGAERVEDAGRGEVAEEAGDRRRHGGG